MSILAISKLQTRNSVQLCKAALMKLNCFLQKIYQLRKKHSQNNHLYMYVLGSLSMLHEPVNTELKTKFHGLIKLIF